jgi:hypothetical protein
MKGQPRSTRGTHRSSLEDRFWSLVDRRGDDECWEWAGSRTRARYGILRENPRTEWKAHRLSWALHNGPVPDGALICHHCDNPPCVNPSHLYAGNAKSNAQDRASRGRGGEKRGESAPAAKLTDAQVEEIRMHVVSGRTQQSVADEYGIHQSHVSRLVRRTIRAE